MYAVRCAKYRRAFWLPGVLFRGTGAEQRGWEGTGKARAREGSLDWTLATQGENMPAPPHHVGCLREGVISLSLFIQNVN